MTLRDLLVDAAGQLDDVTTELGSDGAVTWSRAGRPFASVSRDGTSAAFAGSTTAAGRWSISRL